jgi:hypothetical protein
MERNSLKGHGFQRFVKKHQAYDKFVYGGVNGDRGPVAVFARSGKSPAGGAVIQICYASSGQVADTLGPAQKFYAKPID